MNGWCLYVGSGVWFGSPPINLSSHFLNFSRRYSQFFGIRELKSWVWDLEEVRDLFQGYFNLRRLGLDSSSINLSCHFVVNPDSRHSLTASWGASHLSKSRRKVLEVNQDRPIQQWSLCLIPGLGSTSNLSSHSHLKDSTSVSPSIQWLSSSHLNIRPFLQLLT